MMKRVTLVIMMMISLLGLFSFKYSASNDDEGKTSYVSYYHDKFNGKKTASGEIFQNSKFTAAHRSLPFGTRVKLTNIKNGKSVVVKVNDRGPFHSSRSLDISKAAFEEIGSSKSGNLAVEYEVVKD